MFIEFLEGRKKLGRNRLLPCEELPPRFGEERVKQKRLLGKQLLYSLEISDVCVCVYIWKFFQFDIRKLSVSFSVWFLTSLLFVQFWCDYSRMFVNSAYIIFVWLNAVSFVSQILAADGGNSRLGHVLKHHQPHFVDIEKIKRNLCWWNVINVRTFIITFLVLILWKRDRVIKNKYNDFSHSGWSRVCTGITTPNRANIAGNSWSNGKCRSVLCTDSTLGSSTFPVWCTHTPSVLVWTLRQLSYETYSYIRCCASF